VIYLIGSLRNPAIPELAEVLRTHSLEVFDDWHAAGPRADDHWQEYETHRGRSYGEALKGAAAVSVFRFDKLHLDKADTVVLVMPAGKSGHLEFGYSVGMGKRGIVFFDKEPERWDVMYQFASAVCFGEQELINALRS
jgi:hypothetical protein